MSKKVFFKPKKVAVAVAATLLTSVAVASVVQYVIDESNMTRAGDETIVYADATKAVQRGYLVVDDKEGIVAPGIGAYTEVFSTGGTTYQGCIMSSKGPDAITNPLISTCGGDPDSGKRFKLKSVDLNQPMDIAFNLTNTGDTNLYNIYGKFTNDTGANATGFTVQIGTGIGANFRELPNVTIVGGTTQLGKYPGGLFGGSPAEGLPFFNVESARFSATPATETSVHTRTTNGMPAQYTDLFPAGWLPLDGVPDAWFWDNDGMPWTDNKLLAYTTNGTDWFTFEKKWYANPALAPAGELVEADIAMVLADFDGGGTVNFTTLPTNLNPLVTDFVNINTLTTWLNTAAGLTGSAAYKTQDVVNALLGYLKLEQQTVFPVGAGWTVNPPTVTDPNALDALVATWDTSLGDDGLYVLAAGYTGITGAVETSTGVWTVTADQMEDFWEAGTYEVVAGYSQGVIEDLSNVNVYSAVQVAGGVTGPLTMRVYVTDASAVVPAPLPPATTTSSGGGGCAIGGDGRFDPTLPALAAAGLVFFGLRRFKSGK